MSAARTPHNRTIYTMSTLGRRGIFPANNSDARKAFKLTVSGSMYPLKCSSEAAGTVGPAARLGYGFVLRARYLKRMAR